MNFNQLISNKLSPLLTKHGLIITQQSDYTTKFESEELAITLSHSTREGSNTLWIDSKKPQKSIEIDDQAMKAFFHSDLKLNGLTKENFINNVLLFFGREGKELLKANSISLINLGNYDEQRSEKFTSNVVHKQYLKAANKAWENKNYSDFIRYIDKVGKNNLDASFKQKYKIAQQKSCG